MIIIPITCVFTVSSFVYNKKASLMINYSTRYRYKSCNNNMKKESEWREDERNVNY